MFLSTFVSVALAASALQSATACKGPLAGTIKNLVTFGDSYTSVDWTGDHGTSWPTYAARDGNFTLYPFAKAGATCSNNLTYRPFPSLFESQLPLYFDLKKNGTLRLDPAETVYTLWIGTNDVGVNSLLVGQGAPDVTLVDTTKCAVNWVRTLYEHGARNFLFQNMVPLRKTPLYSADSWPNTYWTAERNTTEWSVVIKELVNSGNALSRALLELLAPTLPGAHIGIFDSYSLFTDMLEQPQKYLNGTAPLNVTSCINKCVYQPNENTTDTGNCTTATGTDVDSYLWYDELHPSEQTDRNVAKAVAAAIRRTSEKWTTWLS